MIVVRRNEGHRIGAKQARHRWLVKIDQQDMQTVFDRLYVYNDIIDNPQGDPGNVIFLFLKFQFTL